MSTIRIIPVTDDEDEKNKIRITPLQNIDITNTNNKEQKNDKKLKKIELNIANANLESKDQKLSQANKDYQNKLSEEYKKSGVNSNLLVDHFNSAQNKVLKYETKNEPSINEKLMDNAVKISEATKNVPEEIRNEANNALNDWKYAKYQADAAKVNVEDTNFYDKTLGNVTRALVDLGDVFTAGSNKYIGEDGKEYFLPTYNQLKQQKVSEDYNTGVGKFLGDASYNMTKILASQGINLLAPGVGSTMYWTDMASDNFQNVKNQGYDTKNAILNTIVSTGSEYIIGKLLGSATKGLTGGKTNQFSNAISNATNKLLKNPTIANIIGQAGSEATEEFLQEYISNINDLITLEGSTNAKDYIDVFTDPEIFQEALYSAGIGALSGGVIGSVNNEEGKQASMNTKMFQEFRTQLENKKQKLTDENEIAKYDKAISAIDDYLKKPFTTNAQTVTDNINTLNQETPQKAYQQATQNQAIDNAIAENNLIRTEIKQPMLNKKSIDQDVNTFNLASQKLVDNNSKNIYNINQEGVNYGTGQNPNDGRTTGNILQGLVNEAYNQNDGKNRQFTKAEWKEFEKYANSTKRSQHNEVEQSIVNNIKDNFNKEVVFFDASNAKYQAGASIDSNNVIYVPYNVGESAKNFIAYHEVLESNIRHNKQLRNSYIDIAIDEIINDPNFEATKKSFISGQANLENVSDRLIAKDIICDTFAQQQTGIPIDYKIYLSDNTKEVIDYNIQAFNNELSKNNSNAIKQDDVLKINNTSQDNNFTTNTNQETNVDDKVAQLLDKRPQRAKKTSIDKTNDAIQEIVNKGHYIDKLAKKANNPELKFKYDKILNSQAEGHYAIGVAQTDNNGKKIGKSLIEIWRPVERAGLVEDFSNYLLHKHNIDRYSQGKPVFGDAITSEISQEEVSKYENSHPEFIEWAKDVYKYNRNNLKNMVDAGLTSAEAEEYYNNTYNNYVRIYRDVTGNAPIQMTTNGIKVNSPIKKAKGGNQNILPLKDSMAQQTIEIKNAIRRNQFGLELLKTLKNGEKDVNYDGKNYVLKNNEGENSFVNKTDDGKYYFTVYENGTPIKMEIDEGIYKAFEKSKWKDPQLFSPVRKLSKWQRSVLTIDNPLFIATNFFKDIGDAPLNSKYASKFHKNYVRALHQIATKGELYQQYMAMGGGQNTYFDYDKGVVNNNKGLIETIRDIKSKEGSLKQTPRAFLNSIRNLNEVIEQAPRLAEFISTIEDGKSITEAMYNSAEITTNFKRGGDLAKMANRNGANFLNASIQGFDKQIRNFTGQNGAKGYINILLKATIWGVAPSLLNDLLLKDDEDYEELPEYVKDSYFLFKTEEGKFIRIPKGRVTSIFGSVARRFKNQLQGKEDPWSGFVQQTMNQVAPNDPLQDNILAPLYAIASNTSWNGGDIVPERLQNQLPKNQYDEQTDAISKWLGGKLNYSPKKLNYLLDQYSGGIGDVVLPMITPEARQNPLSAKFTTDSVLNNKNISIFYDTEKELEKKANDSNASDEDILSSKYLTTKKKEISDLYKEKREIQNSKLTNKKKYEKVRDKQNEINKVAKEALENYDKINMRESNYAIVGEFKYKRSYDKETKEYEWTKQRSK